MKLGEWYELLRVEEDASGELRYGFPHRTERMWERQLRDRLGMGLGDYLAEMQMDLHGRRPLPSVFIFFPKDYAMSCHLSQIRRVWQNLHLVSYEIMREDLPSGRVGEYMGTGAVVVWSKYVLRKLAEVSPAFLPAWRDLHNLAPRRCGIYLAGEPSGQWLESIRSDELGLFQAFSATHAKDRLGGEWPQNGEKMDQLHRAALARMGRHEYAEAEEILEELLLRWPEVVPAWRGLVRCALMQQGLKRGCKVLLRAQNWLSNSDSIDLGAVDMALEAGDLHHAKSLLNRLS